MSPLPERRKSAEEIARLREEMGIPSDGQHPFAPGSAPAPQPPAVTPLQEDFAIPAEETIKPNGGWVPRTPPISPMPDAEAPVAPTPQREEVPASFSPFVKEDFARPVEPDPVPVLEGTSTHLPTRRHTKDELTRLNYQNFVPASVPMSHIQQQTAHWFLITLGYLLSFAGGVGGLLIAGLIAWKKPRSRHHAGIMLVIAVLVLVFGILYYLKKSNAS